MRHEKENRQRPSTQKNLIPHLVLNERNLARRLSASYSASNCTGNSTGRSSKWLSSTVVHTEFSVGNKRKRCEKREKERWAICDILAEERKQKRVDIFSTGGVLPGWLLGRISHGSRCYLLEGVWGPIFSEHHGSRHYTTGLLLLFSSRSLLIVVGVAWLWVCTDTQGAMDGGFAHRSCQR